MGVVIELAVPGEQFAPGRVLSDLEDVDVEFERTVTTVEDVFPYLWVRADDHARFCQTVQLSPVVEDVRLLHREGGRGLYRVRWRPAEDDFMSVLRDRQPAVRRASGPPAEWEFELWFDSNRAVERFQTECSDRDLRYSVRRVSTDATVKSSDQRISDCQWETLSLALEEGFFDVPRETTSVELAEQLGVSDQAVSARIRRGIKQLVEMHDTDRETPAKTAPEGPR